MQLLNLHVCIFQMSIISTDVPVLPLSLQLKATRLTATPP